MADRPAAELVVDTTLVRRLLDEQCRTLPGAGPTADLSLEIVSEGWDNVMLRLGTSLAVRVPRRAVGARLLVNEQRWLPRLAERLDVLVPAPVVAGVPGAGYPWHWSVVPWIDGTAAGTVDRARLRGVAEPLAAFFGALHSAAPADAPVNEVRGGPLEERDDAVRERLSRVEHPRVAGLTAVWEAGLDAPAWDGPPVWLHGDPHPFNLVVSDEPSGEVSLRAVVDFGDMTSGDPACDLAAAWLVFDRAGRERFVAAVERAWDDGASGDLTHQGRPPEALRAREALWRRARGWAVAMGTALLAHSDDDPTFAALGARVADELLQDD